VTNLGQALANNAAVLIALVFLAAFMAVTLVLASRQDDF
jgi:hypothetical protein